MSFILILQSTTVRFLLLVRKYGLIEYFDLVLVLVKRHLRVVAIVFACVLGDVLASIITKAAIIIQTFSLLKYHAFLHFIFLKKFLKFVLINFDKSHSISILIYAPSSFILTQCLILTAINLDVILLFR